MTKPDGPDWIWLASRAIDEFKEWRIRTGATAASASSYASGARAFVRYCRRTNQSPQDAIASFHDYLTQAGELSAGARSDYQSHARDFVRFLDGRSGARLGGPKPDELPGPREEVESASPLQARGGSELASADTTDAARESGETPWFDSLSQASTAELLSGYASTLEVLRSRGVLRTANAPAGDYAEWLVWKAFGGTIEPNSTRSHDVTDALGRRLQVKARLVSKQATRGQLQTSTFRSWTFDFAVLVQLADRDYSVVRASMLPIHLFDEGQANASWSKHVRGWSVFMTPTLMGHPESVDVTVHLQAASKAE